MNATTLCVQCTPCGVALFCSRITRRDRCSRFCLL